MTRLTELPLHVARSRIAAGDFSSAEYFDAFAKNAGELDPDLHAFIHLDLERAREKTGSKIGPLGSIPFAIKDNIVTSDMPTTCGSRILPSFRSPVNATAVDRLLQAGAYAIGKTNLDEFAMGSSTEHSAFGPTKNPWDPTRVAGGSSGGSAAAVAARMVPFAIGSDTGGSVRQPAALCGVTGLKPTWGRVSRSGLVAFASSLDQIGIFTKSARDCADVLSVIAGSDPADSTSSSAPVGDYASNLERGVKGLKFGVIREAVDGLDGSTRQNFLDSLAVLTRGGAIIEETSLPAIRSSIAVYYIVANAEASANLARFDGIRYGHRSRNATNLKSVYFRSRSEGFGEEVKRRIMLGTFALSSGYYDAYYGKAQTIRALIRRELDRQFAAGIDFLLTPTTPGPAFRIGEKIDDPLSMYLSDIFTAPANLAGLPAIAVPSGLSPEGLPLSLQIMGPRFSEGELLRAAHFFESENGWNGRVPPHVE